MKKFFKFVLFLILVSGWVLAASAVHVVRAPGLLAGFQKTESVGRIVVIPKESLAWRDTFVDLTKWTPTDVSTHPVVVQRISETGHKELLNHILEPAVADAAKALPSGGIEIKSVTPVEEETAAPAPKTEPEKVEKTTGATGGGVQDSIFDFPEKK